MSIEALQNYTNYSKFSRYLPEKKRREKWEEQVERVFSMHEEKYGRQLDGIREDFLFAKKMVQQRRVLGSQRALQFGGGAILKNEARIYNCSASYADRPRFFQECMYLLLCGCGTGFSVQKHHVELLPGVVKRENGQRTFVIGDSIEGWADSIGVLVSSFFDADDVPFPEYRGYEIEFDFSQIRPEGSPISWGGKAPGPKGLQIALKNIEALFHRILLKESLQEDFWWNRLRPIDAYDIIMYASDAVLSGGIRRSATLCLFSPGDAEMMNAKTGRWFIENPQRGRSNNSVLLLRNETSQELFNAIKESTRQFGEPGFIWADDKEALYNPCVEIGMYAKDEQGRSGWSFCNLCEINIKKATTPELFLDACKAASIIGTLQAGYDSFPYLGAITESIVRKEALLGVSMTGMMDKPEIAFDYELQRAGAQVVLDTNERIAKELGLQPCARGTCVKPAGTTSCILGTASGIHPHHARRYFRRVLANKFEFPLQYFEKINPRAVEKSVWGTDVDKVVTFACEVPEGARIKNDIDAITLLNYVLETQRNWVMSGRRPGKAVQPWLRHNVSNTITVKEGEWGRVFDFIYANREFFAGISLLPESGDKDYPQAPFTAVLKPEDIVSEYGSGSIMASGLIVDGLKAFDGNLWAACDCILGIGELIEVEILRKKILNDAEMLDGDSPWIALGLNEQSPNDLLEKWLDNKVPNRSEKLDWIRRARQFAKRYFANDLRRTTYCLKDVNNWKAWCDRMRDDKEIDWDDVIEEANDRTAPKFEAGEACAGGKCDLGDLGIILGQQGRK